MPIQLFIISSFFAFSLIHGILAGRGVHTFKKFAVGDKNFKTTTLVATLISTNIGAGTLFIGLQHIYSEGLYYTFIFLIIGRIIGPLMMSRWMILRMQEFLAHYSIAESMGALFGNRVRVITALFCILWCAGIAGVQIQYITENLHYFLDIEDIKKDLLLYSFLSILLLYAMRGGVRAVTSTDIVLFITFTVFLLTLIYLASHAFQTTFQIGKQNIISPLNKGPSSCTHKLFIGLLGIGYIIPNILCPATIQRFYMASDIWQAKCVFTYTYSLISIFVSCIIIVGLLLKGDNPHLDPKKLLDYLLSFYPSDDIHGFAFIAILALGMSTADSCIHNASLLFTNDLAPFLKLPSDNKNQLLQARIATCITGTVTLLLILYQEDSWNLLLFISSLYIPIIPIPFMLAVFGFRPRTKSVLWGMGTGLMTTISFHYFGLDTYFDITCHPTQIFIALLMHLLLLLGNHCICSTIDDKK